MYIILVLDIFNGSFLIIDTLTVLTLIYFRQFNGNTPHNHTQMDTPHNFIIYLTHEFTLIT